MLLGQIYDFVQWPFIIHNNAQTLKLYEFASSTQFQGKLPNWYGTEVLSLCKSVELRMDIKL